VDENILDLMNNIEIEDNDIEAIEEFFSKRNSDPTVLAARLKYQVIHDFTSAMYEQSISKANLAGLLGKSRQYVGRIFEEKSNFTLKSLASLACALNLDLSIQVIPKADRCADSEFLEVEYKEPIMACGGFNFPGVDNHFATEFNVAK
jgi:hypothetical protein